LQFVESSSSTVFTQHTRMHIWAILAAVTAGVGVIQATIHMNQAKIDRFFMGVFRDLGRYKARKRRFQTSTGLMVTLLRQDDPTEDLLLGAEENEDDSNLPVYTKDELLEFGDGSEGRPILLSIFGRVYDVSAGAKFYGPKGMYRNFAGHDVTYSLSTGCRTDDCLDKPSEELDEKDLKEGKRWLSFFHLHDKYPLKGKLEDSDYLALLMSELVDKTIATGKDGKPLMPLMK
jgi:predicted heme/steroid binding protein